MFEVITDKDTQEGIITVKQVSFGCHPIFTKCSLVYFYFSVQRKNNCGFTFHHFLCCPLITESRKTDFSSNKGYIVPDSYVSIHA